MKSVRWQRESVLLCVSDSCQWMNIQYRTNLPSTGLRVVCSETMRIIPDDVSFLNLRLCKNLSLLNIDKYDFLLRNDHFRIIWRYIYQIDIQIAVAKVYKTSDTYMLFCILSLLNKTQNWTTLYLFIFFFTRIHTFWY